jgi:hypothetical protein
MRISIVLSVAVMAIGLSACQTAAERRAADESNCRSYGFRSGTDAMARCLLDTDLDRRADFRAFQARTNRDMFYRPVIVERRIIVQR